MENKKSTKIIVDVSMIEELHAALKELLAVVSTKKLTTEKDTVQLKKVQKHLSNASLLFQISKPATDDKQ